MSALLPKTDIPRRHHDVSFGMSALLPKTDIPRRHHDVSFGPKAGMAARVECTFRENSHLTKVVRVARRDQNAALQKPRGHLKNAL
jgi:hypothetical protein